MKLFVRLLLGALFFGHGTQKLFGWFGGKGLDATAKGFESMGIRPGRENAIAASVAEAGGGALIAAGAETPFAAAALTASMLTAIHRVHFKNGVWVSKGGFEYNAVLIGALMLLVEHGPGRLSIDRARGAEHTGSRWAFASLALGAAGAVGANRLAARMPPPPPAAPAEQAAQARDEAPVEAGG